MALGKFVIEIGADTSLLQKDMSAAVGIVQSSTKQIENSAKNDAERLAKDWAQRSIDITKNISIAQQDELVKPYIELRSKYDEDLAHFESILGAKEQLTAEYTANIERLDKETLKKTTYGQIIDGVGSDMTSSLQNFFNYSNEGFMNFGNLAKNVLNEVYNEIIKFSVVKPLVSSLTNSALSFLSPPSLGFASSSSPVNYNLDQGGALTNAYFQPSSFGYASGGYTGDGGKYEPKGVVHGGEYVIPSWMVQKNKSLISDLETTRARGYFDGGSVGGNVSSGGNMRVEIKNQSSSSLAVTSATQTYDSEGAVLSIVIDGIQKNKMGLRDMMGGR